MKINKKIIVVLLFIMGIVGLLVGSIAYYRIVVSGSIEGSTGNAVFALRDTEAGESWNNKVINLGQINPGDSGSFDVVMDASGSTVDMYATLSIDRGSGDTELPTNLMFYTTSDHKSELHKYYSFLEKNGSNKETLTIYWYWNPYIDDVEDTKYINKSFNASINVSAIQISEYAMMKNGSSIISSSRLFFWKDDYRSYIRLITFENDLSNLPNSCTGDANLCWDISYNANQKKKVYAYLADSGLKDSKDTTKSLYNLYIVSDVPIFAPISSSNLFENFYKLASIDFNNNFNTSKVTNMKSMFSGCSSLTELDLSNFNTSKVINMNTMFANCRLLLSLNVDNFNTSIVRTMESIFYYCESLIKISFTTFNTLEVTSMDYMFVWASSLTDLNLSSFDTSNVTLMEGMFMHCSSLTNLNLANFNTSKVTSMMQMFSGCSSLTSLDLSNFNTINVTNMKNMFRDCSSLLKLNLSNLNMSKVTAMSMMFENCSKLSTTINITNSNITDYISIFSNAATANGAKITVNYIAALDTIAEGETQSLIDKIIATKSPNSNIVKGSQI